MNTFYDEIVEVPPSLYEDEIDDADEYSLFWSLNPNVYFPMEVPLCYTRIPCRIGTLEGLCEFFRSLQENPPPKEHLDSIRPYVDQWHDSLDLIAKEYMEECPDGTSGGACCATMIHLKKNDVCYHHIILDAGYFPKGVDNLHIYAQELFSLLESFKDRHPDFDMMSSENDDPFVVIPLTGDKPRGTMKTINEAYGI